MRIIDADCPELMETIGRQKFENREDIQEWLNGAPTLRNYTKLANITNALKERIPEALYDMVSEKYSENRYLSIWAACLECVREMADAWEEVNGDNLV